MIAEIGHYALVLALACALAQGSLPMLGARNGEAAWMALARPAALAQLVFVALAFGALVQLFVSSDFSVELVWRNSHSAKPLLYKISGVWGNHEGSMVLWVLILALFGSAVAAFGSNLPATLQARVLGVQAWIALGFLLFILFTSNPFTRLDPPPLDGRDLNPLLQDPGLAFHPPFLYLGYVGFSLVFSFAVAALIEGRVDPAWARWVRPWTLAAWCALTAGIALGSWWAYYELGWGGWWFWDPVENASFMPWLLGTALLHSATVVEKRDALKSWTILLAILTFALSLMGTFLVRSGVLTSVHAFATDPKRGLFILGLLVVAVGGALLLYAVKAPGLKQGGLFAPISREGALVLNNLLLSAAAATVFIGTLYPLLLDAVSGDKVSVGPAFFNGTFMPLMAPLVAAMAVGPLLSWKRSDLAGVLARLKLAAGVSVVMASVAGYMSGGSSVFAPLGIGLAAWLLVGTLVEFGERVQAFRAPWAESWRRARLLPRSAYGMTVAHAGFAFLIAGVTGAAVGKLESIQIQRPGETVTLAGYAYTLESVRPEDGPNYQAETAVISVRANGRLLARLTPEKRFYPVTRQPTTEAAIHTLWYADLYAVLGDGDGKGGWTTRYYYEPLVPWIWLGAMVVALGGLLSLSDRRFRLGLPARRAKPARAAA